jgi:predicted aspartyl protease
MIETNLKRDFRAFTTKAEGQLRVLISRARVWQAKSLNPPQPIEIEAAAIWDTGAMMTAVSPQLADRLKLIPISKVTISSAGDRFDADVYKIDVLLPNGFRILGVNASRAKNIDGADMLIGMDIIATGDFAVTNADQRTWFSFRNPSDTVHIDYVADAIQVTQKRQHKAQARRLQRKGRLK